MNKNHSGTDWKCWIVVVVCSAVGLEAQTNDEINAGLQFSFSPPGARSMAMGNAFTGRPNDATAAYANPAGLLHLSESEASIELRSSTYTTRYPSLGSATGEPSFCDRSRGWGTTGDEGCLDTLEGLQFKEWERGSVGPAFIAYVYVPVIDGDDPFAEGATGADREPSRWRVAVFRHELARFRALINRSEGSFIRGVGTLGPNRRSRLSGIIGNLELDIQNFGGSLAYAVSDRLWLGASLSYYDFELDAVTRRYRSIDNAQSGPNFALPGGVDFSDANETDRHLQQGSDGDVGVTLGLLLRNPDDLGWGFGVVYRQAVEFDFDYAYEWRQQAQAEVVLNNNPNFADPGIERALSGVATFETPDYVSLGLSRAFRVGAGRYFRVALEYDRVGYSNLEPESNIDFNVLRDGKENCGDFDVDGNPLDPPAPCFDDEGRLAKFRVDDANEIHLGFEYDFTPNVRNYFVRLGAWLDPDHQMRFDFDQDDVGAGLPVAADNLRAPVDRYAPRFFEGKDEIHLTGGLGARYERSGVHFGFDLSDRAEIFSVSAVFRPR